ncbi:hypothetical protein J6590_068664 [Homalodisca vitripennis]|nr:hypothetical protein J6590_068664 [Homalodisca vitripennis]
MKVSVKDTHKCDRSLSIHIKDGSLLESRLPGKAKNGNFNRETRNREILGLVFAIACGLALLVALVAARL